MRKMLLVLNILLLVFSAEMACASAELDLSYFAFSRSDERLCPSPICGGMFVRQPNSFMLRCPDGVVMAECYIADLDLSALRIAESEAVRIREAFLNQRAIIRGSLGPFSSAFPNVSVLIAGEVWEEKGTARPGPVLVLLRDNGKRCVAEPCFWLDAWTLNMRSFRNFSDLDLGPSGASENERSEAARALAKDGLIASGFVSQTRGTAGDGLLFMAPRFYLNTQKAALCGGPSHIACPAGMFCDILSPQACTGAELTGACKSVPEVCPMIYSPVCGCDGKTYASDCERLAAQILLRHAGECASVPASR